MRIDGVHVATSHHRARAANHDRCDPPLTPVEEAVAVPTRSTSPAAPPSVLEEADARRCWRRSCAAVSVGRGRCMALLEEIVGSRLPFASVTVLEEAKPSHACRLLQKKNVLNRCEI
jgi:hypothetical protein